jgi:hypothetical protein
LKSNTNLSESFNSKHKKLQLILSLKVFKPIPVPIIIY